MHDQTDFESEWDQDDGSRWRLLIDGSIVDLHAERTAPALRLAIDGSLSGSPHALTEFCSNDDPVSGSANADRTNEQSSTIRPKLVLFS
jgi:hypothetical protein